MGSVFFKWHITRLIRNLLWTACIYYAINLYTMADHIQIRAAFHFLSYVKIAGPDECWEWDGTYSGNYGVYYSSKHADVKPIPAHRRSYHLFVGPITKQYLVRHTCDNPACVNPAHLKTGTQKDNMRDRTLRGRNKLSVSDILEIFNSSLPQTEIALQYGTSQNHVSNIKSGKRNAPVTEHLRKKKRRKKF